MSYVCVKCGTTSEQPLEHVEVFHLCPKAKKAMTYQKMKEAK